jgi:hypothetical protein
MNNQEIYNNQAKLLMSVLPYIKDRQELLKQQFDGMSKEEFTYEDHQKAFAELLKEIRKSFTNKDKEFIKSFFSLEPRYDLIDIKNLQEMPAIQWKTQNLQILKASNVTKFKEQIKKLEEALG